MRKIRKTAKQAWDVLLNHGRVFSRRPGIVISFFLRVLICSNILKQLSSNFSAERYLDANRLPQDRPHSSQFFDCELLIVATKKDFSSLSLAVASAIKSQKSINFTRVNIVVPKIFLSEAKSLLFSSDAPIVFIDEDIYFEANDEVRIEEAFGVRSGWVKQQLIKIRHICNSNAQLTLVQDADTFLLRERAWFDTLGKQIIFQSEEFNPEYYNFMDRLRFKNSRKFSFVTHYMLFDKQKLEAALQAAGIYEQSKQVTTLTNHSNLKSESPFSIDYEIYGQYLLANNLCSLRKWSHRDIDPEFILNVSNRDNNLQKLSRKWSSVSVHSWHRP